MGANMRCEKNSLALLSSKRTKAFSRSRADEAFALPVFSDVAPSFSVDRSCIEPKVAHHVHDVEQMKQTMLQHESMFKEQLYELHRLYKVQRLLMEETQRKSLAGHHPHSDSPSSNSSHLYNADSCRAKEEMRFWEASDVSKRTATPFFLGQIDVNKPCEDKNYVDRVVYAAACPKDSHRPIIDLERPAEEHVEAEAEDEKPVLMRNSLFQQLENALPLCATQCSSLSGRSANMTMQEEKSNNISRELPSSSKWRSFKDCFVPEHSRQKEVSFFPLGSSDSKNRLVEDANLPSSQTTRTTSLFGVNLKQEINSRHVQSPGMQSNLHHVRREPYIAGSDACDRSMGQTSELPHWLLQGLRTTSATTISPINLAHPRQHQTSPFFKQDERTSCFDERVSTFSAQQEHPDSWTKSGGGSPFVLRAPQCKSSSAYVLDGSTGNVQGFHKSAQASSVNESTSFMSPSSIERRLGVSLSSLTNHPSSPVPPWILQRAPSSLMPQISKPVAENLRPSNAFCVNSSSPWVNVPAHEQVQEAIFAKCPTEAGEGSLRDIAGSFPSLLTRTEVTSKRLIFGFMPTASDLDLTLGLDLNENEAMERVQRIDDSLSNEQKHSKLGLRSEPLSNDFDLNEQLGQAMDAESQAIPTSSNDKFEGCKGLGWRMSSGVKEPYLEEWHTSHHSSSLKMIHEETVASTATTRHESVTSSLQTGRHRDAPYDEQLHVSRVNESSLLGGRSSDGSGLASCESRSTPIPTFTKVGVSTHSGEACQNMTVKQQSQEVLFEEASTLLGRKQGSFSAMLGSLDVYHANVAEGSPMEMCTSKDTHVAAAGTSKGKVEAFEAAHSLLLLSLDAPSVVVEDPVADGDEEIALKWLADIIPQDDTSGIDGRIAGLTVRESILGGSHHCLEDVCPRAKVLDSFELAVLSLKPNNPTSEAICTQPIERCDVAEECMPPSNLRRRSLRRGRSGKDFQKEMLPSIASLSRQEITEDLQIIEGLVKSATEAMARCSLSSKEDVSWSLPALSSAKTSSKAKGLRTCKAGKQNGLLRVCSWGESTRRRRMRRQRRVCMPLGV